MPRNFPHYKQLNSWDCGPVCLRMIARYYGKYYSTDFLAALSHQREQGSNLLGISEAAEQIGMHTVGAKLTFSRLIDDIPLPGIAHWRENHFVVVIEANENRVVVADPNKENVVSLPKEDFLDGWTGSPNGGEREGVVLLLEPTADFYALGGKAVDKSSPTYIWKITKRYKYLLWFLVLGSGLGCLLTLAFPFILQTLVDEGIEKQDDNLVNLILVAWILLFISQVGLDFIRHFILFHIGSKVNIRLLTDLMMKILRLPVRFFQTRMPDDVMQTLYENPRLQRFLTNEALSVVFAGLMMLLFSLVLLAFSWKIFGVFLLGSLLQGFFVWASLRNRKTLHSTRHEFAASHFSKLTDLIRGIKDIKINGAERTQRWVWERSEAKLYSVGKQHIVSNDLLRNVPVYLGELRNIFIIYLAAKTVLDPSGGMTVGVLVAIIFILTQLNNPLKTLIEYCLGWQEARSTLEQMNEIHRLESEATEGGTVDVLPEKCDVEGVNISFRYDNGPSSPWILQNLDFKIQWGKITAIVGPSGSGKSTLLHLMLNFYQPEDGFLKVGDLRLSDIRSQTWLKKCGVVQQDGHIFHDTIARNIALGDHIIDNQRLLEAARIANILPFMERMRLGFNTVVGNGGVGLSKGQRQGILIARAVYKNPEFLFLDEATNDLDADNERIVLKNLQEAFRGKTIVLIASRMELPIRIDQHIPLAPPRIKSKEANTTLAAALGGNGNGVASENFYEKILAN